MVYLQNLRSEMARRGMTQKDLAQAIGSTEASVSLWLSGERTMKLSTAFQIRRTCFPECSTDYLFEGAK